MQQIEVEIKPRCDDGTLPKDNVFQTLADLSTQIGVSGTQVHLAHSMRSQMEEAGFTEIVERRYKLPLGPWSSDPTYQRLGLFYEMFWRTGCQGWLMGSLTRILRVSTIYSLADND